MMNPKPNVLIFSVFQKSQSLVANATAHSRVLQTMKLQGIPFVELRGKHEGMEELSILVQGFEHRSMVENLCKEFNQGFYIESHNDRKSFFVLPNGERRSAGTLKGVTKEVAEAHGSFCYSPIVSQHYVAMS